MSRKHPHFRGAERKKLRVNLQKASGRIEPISPEKLTRSLIRCRTPEDQASRITENVLRSTYDQMPTEKLRRLVLQNLKGVNPAAATLYNLSRAVMQLGPSGFPFEKLVGKLYESEGYATELNQTRPGRCVDHEIDVVAKRKGEINFIECKFHNVSGFFVDLKTALYIKARSDDLKGARNAFSNHTIFSLVTNTRFSSEALKFGECAGINLVSWTHPENGSSLVHRLESSGLIPLTALTSLPKRLATLLMADGIVTVRDLVDDPHAWKMIARDSRILSGLQREIDALWDIAR